MRGHEVGDEILLLAHAFGYLVKSLLEALVGFNVRLAHFVKDYCRAVLWGNFELTAYVMHYQLFHELVVLVLDKVIVADSRTDKYFFHALDLAYLAQHGEILGVVNFKCGARLRCKTFLAHAESLGKLFITGGHSEIGCRAAYIVYVAFEIGHFRYSFRFRKYRFLAPYSNAPALMKGYGAEVAVAETAAVMSDREAHLLNSRNASESFVRRVYSAHIRE